MSTLEDLLQRTDDERLKRLVSYVAVDPANETLRTDAAEQALNTGIPEIACELLAQAPGELGDRELNLFGLAQMQLKNFGDAAKIFETIVAKGVSDAAVKFNLAWSLAMEKRFNDAL